MPAGVTRYTRNGSLEADRVEDWLTRVGLNGGGMTAREPYPQFIISRQTGTRRFR